MNHEHLAYAWAAFNTGHDRLAVTIGRGSTQHTAMINVKPEMRGSRVSFRRDTIYSHHWWPMAKFIREPARAVLMRTDTYSISTSRHQLYVRRALASRASIPVFEVQGDPVLDHDANIKGYVTRIHEHLAAASRATRYADRAVLEAQAVHTMLCSYIETFGLEQPLPQQLSPFKTADELIAFEARMTQLSLRLGVPIPPIWRQL
jgi:hypothetical protein